jgi:hypothetical protein
MKLMESVRTRSEPGYAKESGDQDPGPEETCPLREALIAQLHQIYAATVVATAAAEAEAAKWNRAAAKAAAAVSSASFT